MTHDTFSGFSSSVFVCIFSRIFCGFFGICLVFSTFLYRIVRYIVRITYKYAYVIIVSRFLLMLYIFQILSRKVFSFFGSFIAL